MVTVHIVMNKIRNILEGSTMVPLTYDLSGKTTFPSLFLCCLCLTDMQLIVCEYISDLRFSKDVAQTAVQNSNVTNQMAVDTC